jgi:hypothetical protein
LVEAYYVANTISSMTTKAAAQRRGGQDDDEFDQFSDPVDDVWVPTVDYRINHILLGPTT